MASNHLAESITLYGYNAAWLIIIGADNSIIDSWRFNNLTASPEIKLPAGAASASSGGELISINNPDGRIIEYPKNVIKIDGATGAKKSDSSSGTSSIYSIGIEIKEAPLQSTANMKMSQFVKLLDDYKTNRFLVIAPTGLTYKEATSTYQPDGFVAVIGKRTNEISWKGEGSIPITIESQATTDADIQAILSTANTGASGKLNPDNAANIIDVDKGGTTVSLKFAPITLSDKAKFIAGEALIKTSA